jgi:hypothetical protein
MWGPIGDKAKYKRRKTLKQFSKQVKACIITLSVIFFAEIPFLHISKSGQSYNMVSKYKFPAAMT